MFIAVIFHCLRACKICVVFVVGIKTECNTHKIRTGTHSLQTGE